MKTIFKRCLNPQGFIMILSKDEAKRMRNTKRFGKVRTNEEYLMLCRLEKEIKYNKKKNRKCRRYTEDVPPICLHIRK